jgi:signal transduction histidine kinase
LISNIIDITKIDAGYFQINCKNCDIIRVVEDITLSIANYIENMGLTITFDTETEEMIIACDPDKIERIMLNLLSNAVKFTPRGGQIFVYITDGDEMIYIHVKDTGIGIPNDMKDMVFERFFQVDKTMTRAKEGSGIGLSLVKSFVEMHDGKIQLLSEKGKGSEFIIGIPKKLVPDERVAEEPFRADDKKKINTINIEFSDIYNRRPHTHDELHT